MVFDLFHALGMYARPRQKLRMSRMRLETSLRMRWLIVLGPEAELGSHRCNQTWRRGQLLGRERVLVTESKSLPHGYG